MIKKKGLFSFIYIIVLTLIVVSCELTDTGTTTPEKRKITIVSPKEGQVITRGDSVEILWSENILFDFKVKLGYSYYDYKDNVFKGAVIADSTENDGGYKWGVVDIPRYGDKYLITAKAIGDTSTFLSEEFYIGTRLLKYDDISFNTEKFTSLYKSFENEYICLGSDMLDGNEHISALWFDKFRNELGRASLMDETAYTGVFKSMKDAGSSRAIGMVSFFADKEDPQYSTRIFVISTSSGSFDLKFPYNDALNYNKLEGRDIVEKNQEFNYVIAGVDREVNKSYLASYTISGDNNTALSWIKRYDDNYVPYSVNVYSGEEGEIIFGGESSDGRGFLKLCKVDGEIIWEKSQSSPVVDIKMAVTDGVEKSIITGKDYIAEYSKDGTEKWKVNFSGADIKRTVKYSDLDYICTGSKSVGGKEVIYVSRVSTAGELQWEKTYEEFGEASGYGIDHENEGIDIAGQIKDGDRLISFILTIDRDGEVVVK